MDRQKLAAQQTAEIKLLQKVNAAHRESFAIKFPGQIEHILRLTAERLQAGLDKRDGIDVANPDTWRMGCDEIYYLTSAAQLLDSIRRGF